MTNVPPIADVACLGHKIKDGEWSTRVHCPGCTNAEALRAELARKDAALRALLAYNWTTREELEALLEQARAALGGTHD